MRIPILSDRATMVIHRIALGLIAVLPLLSLRSAADPYQPLRALAVGVAGLLVALAVRQVRLPRRRALVAAGAALAVVVAGTLVAALVSGFPSAVFGVHGRFQGLVSGATALVAVGIGLGSGKHARILARLVAASLVVQAALIVAQRLSGMPPTGTVGNTVLVGGWLAIATSCTLAAARVERGAIGIALWSAAGAGALCLGLVGSRGAWVGLAAGALPLVLVSGARVRRVAALFAIALVVAGALIAGGEPAAKLDPSSLGSGSAATRLAIWGGTIEMIGDHPLTGTGPGRFLYAFAPYQPVAQAAVEVGVRPDQAHSLLLHVAAESGVPAALAALLFVGIALSLAVAGARRGDAVALIAASGLAAWAGQGVFGIATVEADALAMLCAGMALTRTDGSRRDTQAAGPFARVATGAVALLVVVAAVFYLRADVTHRAGVEAFSAGDMAAAWQLESTAVARNGLVDIYRVGAADAALYAAADPPSALLLLDRGLQLEPASYDLAIARARMLSRAGAPAEAVLDAYLEAVRRYPLGIEVNHEAIDAAYAAGRADTAVGLAEDVLVVYPDDPVALDALGEGRR